MSTKRRLWVVEEFFDGEWLPLRLEVYYTRAEAREAVRDYHEDPFGSVSRIREYTPNA